MSKGALLRSFVQLTNEIDKGLESVSKRALDREVPVKVFHAIQERQRIAMAYIRADVEEVKARAAKIAALKEKHKS